MTAIGSVKRLLTSKDGDIGGIMLNSGMIVDTPRGHGDALRAMLKRGDVVKVEGDESRSARGRVRLRAKRITLSPRRSSREARAEGLKPFVTNAEGFVESFAHTPDGNVTGLRLEDGTVVVTPLREGENLVARVAVGDYVHVCGHRVVSSRHITKIVANRISVKPLEENEEAVEKTDREEESIILYRRRENLPIATHAEVAALPADEADARLDRDENDSEHLLANEVVRLIVAPQGRVKNRGNGENK